jgi:hypothetical protein
MGRVEVGFKFRWGVKGYTSAVGVGVGKVREDSGEEIGWHLVSGKG